MRFESRVARLEISMPAARAFYGTTLGLDVTDINDGALLDLQLAGGHHVLIYPKPDFEPATYTAARWLADPSARFTLGGQGAVATEPLAKLRPGNARHLPAGALDQSDGAALSWQTVPGGAIVGSTAEAIVIERDTTSRDARSFAFGA